MRGIALSILSAVSTSVYCAPDSRPAGPLTAEIPVAPATPRSHR